VLSRLPLRRVLALLVQALRVLGQVRLVQALRVQVRVLLWGRGQRLRVGAL
jgi:hypothetical protein